MAALTGWFVDTSVLVAGSIDGLGASDAPARVLDAASGGRVRAPMTAWHCCLEFYAVTTRLPLPFRLAPADAGRLVDDIVGQFAVRGLDDQGWRRLFTWASARGVAGGRAYDAHIGEVARGAGASVLVTDNPAHFAWLGASGIDVLTSEQAAARL